MHPIGDPFPSVRVHSSPQDIIPQFGFNPDDNFLTTCHGFNFTMYVSHRRTCPCSHHKCDCYHIVCCQICGALEELLEDEDDLLDMNLTAKEERELALLTRISVAIEEGSEVRGREIWMGHLEVLVVFHIRVHVRC